MNRLIVLTIVSMLIISSLVGFVAMHGTMDCNPASQSSQCPPTQVGMITHHVSSFSETPIVFSTTIISLILSVLVAIVGSFFAYLLFQEDPDRRHTTRAFIHVESSSSQRRILTRWLSRLENSPALA